ncbi:c-type cytochrome [Oceanobacillus jeddahense]|uniref:Cytochrome c n=1 Tax=Oceanobacillus jeddahense TaxID=1462527 RepID=A0ABY5JM23_9BACI|nr:cytochrome c [Oceanobacillus jeddahense]UUI01356.1 cytochrome c [Oceanobacillus jeddahense]
MKKNPVIPYAIIAGLGLIAVIIISVIGIDQRVAIQDAEENGEEQSEQAEGDGEEGGESTSADAGEEVYQSNCVDCHGQDLASGSAPDLSQIGNTYSQEEIAEIVENGTDGGMPAFPQLQGEELDALSEWLSEHQ